MLSHKQLSLIIVGMLISVLDFCVLPNGANYPFPSHTAIYAPISTVNPATKVPVSPTAENPTLPSVTESGRISSVGAYAGYSRPLYNEIVKTSQYIAVRDGTKLAVDIYRPAQLGKPVDTPLPVIWMHSRFHRDTLVDIWPWYRQMVEYGYVIGLVDVRGTGASYGSFKAPWSPEETQDAYDLTEWFAAQPWSNGKIGMFGFSYQATSQLMAASTKPPHLKAIIPYKALFDFFSNVYPNGVVSQGFWAFWSIMRNMDSNVTAVDGDPDHTLLQKAVQEHKDNRDILDLVAFMPYRDSYDAKTGVQAYLTYSPNTYLKEIKDSGVAVYLWGNWFDPLERDTLLWLKTLSNPHKIIIGPSSYLVAKDHIDEFTEHLRWFDYWLKGIDNGIMNEAPIYYYTMGPLSDRQGWHSIWQWPLPNQKLTNYYLIGNQGGFLEPGDESNLSLNPDANRCGNDRYPAFYSISNGPTPGWNNVFVSTFSRSRYEVQDSTYRTAPLGSAVEVTGYPVIHLWVNSTARDGDFFVSLEDVNNEGIAQKITEGTLRASHRAISTPAYDNLGLPYHRSFAEDIADLTTQPVELTFDLMPTSYIFDAGDCIQITISGPNNIHILTLGRKQEAAFSLDRDDNHLSYIVLPVIP
jgi:uncharacterized protein